MIAIDGPAASGKGTLARKLASHLGFHHLDSGLTYRAVAHALLQAGMPLDRPEMAEIVAQNIDLSSLDSELLSAHEIGEAASRIAVMPEVRRILVEAQRRFGEQEPGSVIDGRDIGTVVFPDAEIKMYVTASPEVRATRRHSEIVSKGRESDYSEVLQDIIRRDERDMGRKDSPLKPAEDAHLIDTTEMSIETAFEEAADLIRQKAGISNIGS